LGGYLLVMSTAFIAGYVLPSIAGSSRGYVNVVLAAATNGSATGSNRPAEHCNPVQGIATGLDPFAGSGTTG